MCSYFSAAILPMLSSIHSQKVYLLEIWSLHCWLVAFRVLQGIKRHQGSNKCQCQPITIEQMHIFFQSLNFSDYNHTTLWAACCLGFLGILCAGEFTDNSHFNPDIHIAVTDVHINLKYSTMVPFRQGCYIHIGAEKHNLCPMRPLTLYLHVHVHDSTSGPHFILSEAPL